jgi:tetratricopeptide (TPR) repeat protein
VPLYKDQVVKEWYDSLLSDLESDEQTFLMNISVFDTEVTVEAIRHVTSLSNPWDLIEKLTRRYLLTRSRDPYLFTVHGLLREYCYSHLLDGSQRMQLHAKAGDFCRDRSDLAVTQRERSDSLVQAIKHFHKAEMWQNVLSLAHQVEDLLTRQGDWETMRSIYTMALEAAQKDSQEHDEAWCYLGRGLREADAGHYTEACEDYRKCLNIADRVGDPRIKSTALHRMGTVAQFRGHLEEAVDLYHQSIAVSQVHGYELEKAISLHQLGRVAHRQRQYQEARQLYEESLSLKKSLNDRLGIAISLHQLGNLSREAGQYADAIEYYRESFRIKQELNDQQGICSYFQQMGRVARAMRDYDQARQLFQEALEIARKLGDQRETGVTLLYLSQLHLDQEQVERARTLFSHGREILERLEVPELHMAQELEARLNVSR